MPSPNPQYVLKLAADVVAAQEHLNALQAQWDSLFGESRENTQTPLFPRKGGRQANPNGVPARLLETINSRPGETFTVARLQELTGEDRKQIERSLYNLFVAKKIARVERGVYASLRIGIAEAA